MAHLSAARGGLVIHEIVEHTAEVVWAARLLILPGLREDRRREDKGGVTAVAAVTAVTDVMRVTAVTCARIGGARMMKGEVNGAVV